MKDILSVINSMLDGVDTSNRKLKLQDLGYISCASNIHIKHVPFYDPCLILVLSGRKTLFEGETKMVCNAGQIVAVPAPSSFDLRNEPDARTRQYAALIIPFSADFLEELTRSHGLVYEVQRNDVGILRFETDETIKNSVLHYLRTVGNPKLLNHRLMEILLILADKNRDLLSFTLHRSNWSHRVRSIVAADLAHKWALKEVCDQLYTTESTLRRNLKQEGTTFRDLLHEARLSSALMQLLQTNYPIYRIAFDCGYQSVSRFASNFRKRFGIPPKQFRTSASESEQLMAG